MIISLPPTHFAEGYVTVDVLARVFHVTVLDPVLTFLLVLYQLQRLTGLFTSKTALHALHKASRIHWVRDVWTDRQMVAALCVWGIGIAVVVNEQLSRAVRNNFRGQNEGWDKWQGQVVVITGGAGGLGREVIKQLNERKLGIKIAVMDAAAYPEPLPQNVSAYKVDIADPEAVKRTADSIRREVGPPSILINMAGIVRAKSILDMEPKDIDLTYDVNVKSHFYTVQAFLPDMILRGIGHIITIASSTGYVQAANGVAYCASKAAAISFHEGLTEELRHVYLPASSARRIRTSVLCPAHIKTDMFAGFKMSLPKFFAPSLEVSTVGQLVVQTALSGESQHIIEPLYSKFTPLARGLPTWIYSCVLVFVLVFPMSGSRRGSELTVTFSTSRLARRAMGGVRDVQKVKDEKAE
ncbi:hypothetical protein JCM10212_006874 [Sporobolomyces blumeae]